MGLLIKEGAIQNIRLVTLNFFVQYADFYWTQNALLWRAFFMMAKLVNLNRVHQYLLNPV